MPKTNCPACQAAVKLPKYAEIGSTVTCPECDEVFTPPQLQVKAPKKVVKAAEVYDPEEDEDTYKVGRAAADPESREKSRKVANYARAAANQERLNARRSDRLAWHEGPEIWLLILGVGLGGGLPFGFWLARNWEKVSNTRLYWVAVLLVAVFVTAVGLGGSAWAAVRRGRNSL